MSNKFAWIMSPKADWDDKKEFITTALESGNRVVHPSGGNLTEVPSPCTSGLPRSGRGDLQTWALSWVPQRCSLTHPSHPQNGKCRGGNDIDAGFAFTYYSPDPSHPFFACYSCGFYLFYLKHVFMGG